MIIELLWYIDGDNCIRNYYEEIVPLCSDNEFTQHFRLSRNTFKTLAKEYEKSQIFQEIKFHSNVVSPGKSLALFLWFAAHEASSFRDIGDRFNVSLNTVHNILKRLTYFHSSKSRNVIKWPNTAEKIQTERYYSSSQSGDKFSGVIGMYSIEMVDWLDMAAYVIYI